jgi:glycerophosphoryl diester phosphodiesterase
MARQRGATVNLEIKDFDLEATRAQQVLDVVAASGMPAKRLIIQSFFPQNLEAARERLPAVPRSMLALSSFGEGAIDAAVERGAVWVSPQWPITRSYVLKAKARGLKVVPFTLNRASQVRTAKRIGVDAVISDDPVMARRVLR